MIVEIKIPYLSAETIARRNRVLLELLRAA
jgi:hypothetical protein